MNILIQKLRVSLIILVIFILNNSINAKEVNYKTAEQIAINAFILNSGISKSELKIVNVIPAYEGSTVLYYIFNFENSFIIVSADDIAEPVLGYGFSSNINLSKTPPGLAYLLNLYKREISFARNKKIIASQEISEKWDFFLNLNDQLALSLYSPGTYLIESIWGQNSGYQKYCPIDPFTGIRSIIGCGGVALGQILKFWNCRVFPDNTITYTPKGFPNAITVNFYNQNYNWDAMSLDLADDYNSFILYHSAVAIRSNFGSNGTSSSIYQSKIALTTYFGFNADDVKLKDKYLESTWINMLKNEIDYLQPIYYRGEDPDEGGHAWVIDGYKPDNTFHCNWGWLGTNNGWYLLTALNVAGYQFNDDQAAILNIYPELDACSNLPGANVICTSNTSYSISIPSSASVAWTKSSNLIQEGGSTGTTYTVRSASSSQSETGFVKATIFNSQGQVFLDRNKDVWTGKPSFTVEGDEIVGVFEPGIASLEYNFDQGITNVDWTCSDAISTVTGGLIIAKFRAGSQPGYGSVYANATNLCGSKENMLLVEVIGWNSIYPNPATDQLNIYINKEKLSEQLRSKPVEILLYDKLMSLKKHTKSNSEQIIINISDLKPDIYVVQIRIGDKIHEEKIIIADK